MTDNNKFKSKCFDRVSLLLEWVNTQRTINVISVTSNHNTRYEVFYYEIK